MRLNKAPSHSLTVAHSVSLTLSSENNKGALGDNLYCCDLRTEESGRESAV